ncbi:zinc finger protein ZOP1-like [Dioscorea cayenensis subsp. rotundata]|uniref:Zinc finger protein ZOP1-like n=1 Tax=Dioscorea cayennensis subsp. rotundata TaxID=55577 RepID=A0AB40AWC7_DIOCR|nr:zinc finger protein ZOP1-like [Dioscorea cayenensis subsp. rotundata]XP_039118591.1 zinc finger protein ZOP1-like [Dioscorea cayenensis subsp. rotundata]
MTEYWVSQGNKWCDFCKIYIANNSLSIRTHELGQRHKDNVNKRIATMRKESAAKEKQKKDAARALQQIEEKAKRSYQKDLASFQEAKNSCGQTVDEENPEWEYDATSGYYYCQDNGHHFDPNTGLFYSNELGKWITQDEAFTSHVSKPGISHSSNTKDGKHLSKKPSSTPGTSSSGAHDITASESKAGPAPGRVVSTTLNPMRFVKGAQSSIAIQKRKREGEKTKAISKEEEAALRAREAAKKRMEEREKPLLGLYRSY